MSKYDNWRMNNQPFLKGALIVFPEDNKDKEVIKYLFETYNLKFKEV